MSRLTLCLVVLSGLAHWSAAQEPAPQPSPSPMALKAALYGTIYFNGFSNTAGSNNADVPMFATPTGTANLSATVRQTRLGVKVSGATVGSAKLSGVIETDLYGGFPQIGVGETFGQLRVRLAFARLDWQKTSLEAGQDWMLFAPANPVSLAAAGIPLFAAAGNPWMRLPQVRVERRFGGQRHKGQAQFAVLAPSSGDSTAGFVFVPGSGASSKVPYFQGRLAFTDAAFLGGKKPLTLGVSGQWGRGRTGSGATLRDIDASGAAAELSIPMGSKLSLLGEAFVGKNLAGFQAGVFQGINPNVAVASGASFVDGGPGAISSHGGWAQLGFSPLRGDRLGIYVGYGIDDPSDADLASVPARDWRSRNIAWSASVIHKPVTLLSWGVEVRHLETTMLQSGKKTDTHVNLGVALTF